MSSSPTTRMDTTTVTAVSTARAMLRPVTGRPLARAYSSSLATANSHGRSSQVAKSTTRASPANTHRSRWSAVVIAPNRYAVRLAGLLLGRLRDDHHTGGDAAVEHHGQGDVAAGAAAPADQLDGDRGGHGGDEGREDGGLAGEDADRDPGERHVPMPVTDEGEPALDEEDADERCGDADEDGGHEGLAHEVEGQQLAHQRAPPRGSSGPATGAPGSRVDVRWSSSLVVVVAGRPSSPVA